ncbi:glycosyltransferase family 4 protein [Dictyobacter arantiisoli]|uniref:Glycosyl transferase n=1 Tax=Dictyobacter arantiisoli TaxID=2014874 RepID=A0A5A5TCZ5_9CHLR|nr:glycosyltransferase family 4 protein [Dictyobacter arantiisoli]GCF09036.1 glycosyl transferase [Dictyobacter arantiisoli]
MKIAQIAPPWVSLPPQAHGGTENVIYQLVEELVELGHEVTVFAPADAHTAAKQVSFIPKSLLTEGVPWQANLKAYYHLHKSLEYVAEHDFDVVHTHLSSSSDMYIFPLATMLTTPHVTTLHAYFPFDRTTDNWIGDADHYFMEWANHVSLVAISENARRRVSHTTGFVGTVHNGLRLDQYTPTAPSAGDYFVWLGHFTYENGAHLAIEAAKCAGVPLLLAGVKEQYNRDAMEYYRHLVKPSIDGVQIRTVRLASTRDRINLLRQARGLLHPIQWDEPFGMALIEAMATGCPVISLARGAAPELIDHGHSGFLAHNLHEMIAYIKHIDEIQREDVRDHAEQYFSSRIMAEKYLHIYTNEIAARNFSAREASHISTQPLHPINTHNMLSV